MARLIDADRALEIVRDQGIAHPNAYHLTNYAALILREAPTVDAVPVEKYNELREAFVDYVCSGVNNQAPYCKNRIDGDCVDERGWCTYRHCRGFNPDGERKDGDKNA